MTKWIMIITPLLVLTSIAASAEKPKTMRVPLRIQENDNLATEGRMVRLRRKFRQNGAEPIVFEGEEASLLVLHSLEKRIMTDPERSNGHYVHHVKEMEYHFDVETPGAYQIRFLSYYPLQANYNHKEKMDDGEPQGVVDSFNEEPKVWRWTKGKTYDLSKGEHKYIFPSPTAFCGGAKLDKIVLQPVDAAEITDQGPSASKNVLPQKGVAMTRRIKLQKIK
mgnify:CR=1 FL=1